MKKLLLILTIITGLMWMGSTFASNINFSCSGMNCFIAGVHDAGKAIGVTGVVTGKGISEAVQDFIIYLLSFISLIAVIYVMYAGVQLLLNPSDEESAVKTKKIIIGVVLGIMLIWFAWWIVSTILMFVNKGTQTTFIPRAIAATQIRNVDFEMYKNRIQPLITKLNYTYDPAVMSDLEVSVDGAYQHLPDRMEFYANKERYEEVKNAILEYKNNYNEVRRAIELNIKYEDHEIILRGILQSALVVFLEQAQVFKIDTYPEANPPRGAAPLPVTFESKETLDASGTVIPNENYIWWLRTGGDTQKILGKGKVINYTFDTEGTYSVFLTVNSASKNSQGLCDTISFEKSVTVEVTQPEVQFVVRIKDQLADKVVKISTKDALKPISIDASETRFASGYTTTSTEWNFGNGKSDTNEGDPQLEVQQYTPGDHTIQLTLTRNDGEKFSHTILLKVGDPLASIVRNNKSIHKGEKAIFEANKTSNEADVKYIWEVKKQETNDTIYTFAGTRMEYVFGDTGLFFVKLTSRKGDLSDVDTLDINIESRPPNVKFTSEIISPEMPNVYVFDGSNSFDPDYPDNQDLRFEWFVDGASMQLSETNTSNSRGKYTFPEKKTYHILLRVTDKGGKIQEEKRDIKITSILSVKLVMQPAVVKRGAKSILSVTAPGATTYEWKVGGNDLVRTENNRFITSFPSSGTFPITVTVTNADGEINTVTEKMYVTEDDIPFSIIDINSNSSLILSRESTCSGQDAVTVDRANSVSFSADRSVNKDGRNNDLTYFWRIGLNKNSTQKNVSYTFDELGCEEIILTVSDKISGASHTTKTWVKVVNLEPIFTDLIVDPENMDMDPMKINLKLLGAKDPDGLIRSYTWYYYTDRDDQAQGFRITRVPETSFVLPKITGRYYFAVLMEDSNGLKINTKEKSDILYSTPELYVNSNLSTPIIDNFQADTTEVKFGDVTRLSLNVRTPIASDVSEQSEYRWDIDGDGFYDVKTTTPFYEFKYIYPGEYYPKVKVTHKGISTTKTLTITVKNRLVPKASIQMMGNKIIAYNISSGIFQSANWYLDEKKISENKDYLIAEIPSSPTAQNLKLEISDDKTKEFITYPIQVSAKNKILLKKITRPLVILSSLSGGDATEAHDEILWEDPMIPLYLYLGESRGDIRYYAIDTDIEIDTDLSGGKDDDADNKGTASYRSGRPFQIPKGTKRVTVMKIRLIGNNNQDIDTRQIRVTRTFLATTETDSIKDEKSPQNFNLSQEDKDRIEKLRNLIQSTPKEEKAEFDKILDQLGDNWYDVAERIQTLNLFSNRVNESLTLSTDLKNKILEQISLVYTQGDQAIEEKQLALKMITEYLANSPKKMQIFGDANKPGLINEIIDSPEYYEANLKVIQKIMEDYVDPDTTLSDEVKKDIKEKLMILAGSPPAPIGGTIDNDVPDKANTTLTLLLWILGGVVSVVMGGVGIAYARRKLAPQKSTPLGEESTTPPQDIPPSHDTEETVSPTPSGSSSEGNEASTPDWLKEDNGLFGDEDVFSAETPTSPENDQPDWLKDATIEPVATPESPVQEEKIMPESDEAESDPEDTTGTHTEASSVTEEGDIPDWLQGAPSIEEPSSGETVPKIKAPGEETIDTIPDDGSITPHEEADTVFSNTDEAEGDTDGAKNTLSKTESQDDDIPDWLRGSEIVSDNETTRADAGESLENDEEVTHEASPLEDIGLSVKEEVSQNDGKKSKKDTIPSETDLLKGENPENLLEPVHDTLIAPPKKKITQPKKSASKKKTVPSDHLLESEHDMLLPKKTTDTSL